MNVTLGSSVLNSELPSLTDIARELATAIGADPEAEEPAADPGDLPQTADLIRELAERPAEIDRIAIPASSGNATPATESLKNDFKNEFGALAGDKAKFDATMQKVFGDDYDRGLAEQYRQKALAGDFSWLPDIKLVDAQTLGGGNGAYNAAEGVVYINRDVVAADPAKATQVYVEEAGHHLDAKLNKVDAAGDEGELFRRTLAGEKLSDTEVAAIKSQDDHGTITVDGKQVEVEFWFGEDLWDGAKKVASDAVDGVKSAASDVGDYVKNAGRDVAYSVGDAFKEGATGIVDTVKIGLVDGFVGDIVVGGFGNLFQGHIADAWDSVVNGADRLFLQAPRRLANSAIESIGDVLKTPTYIFPERFGAGIRDFIDRGTDSTRTAVNTVVDIGRVAVRTPLEISGGLLRDGGEVLRYWARGDVKTGFERLGMAFVHPFVKAGGAVFDATMIGAQGIGNIAGNTLGLHQPARGLNKDERALLERYYGESLNLEDIRVHQNNLSNQIGMAPHTVGNDIYLPKDCFDENGNLNEKGRLTLVHEAGHVYQSQHRGNGYIHEALMPQAGAMVDGGSRNQGYDFGVPARNDKPFREWNPEQQAEFFETMAKAREGHYRTDTNGDGKVNEDDGEPTMPYDKTGDGVDRAEFELAYNDVNLDGKLTAEDFQNRQPLNLTDEQFRNLVEMWDAAKRAHPDQAIV